MYKTSNFCDIERKYLCFVNNLFDYLLGPGILTQVLLERGARVIALESDRTFIPHLEVYFQFLKIMYC